MSPLDYVIAGAGAWIVLLALGGTSYILVAETVRRLARRNAIRDMRNHPAYPPPVPGAETSWRIFPTSYRYGDVDATWLDAWPTGDDDQINLRFEQIVEAERSQGWAA